MLRLALAIDQASIVASAAETIVLVSVLPPTCRLSTHSRYRLSRDTDDESQDARYAAHASLAMVSERRHCRRLTLHGR